MKTKRHLKIVELIEAEPIETQEDLATKLLDAGFQVTQATVSRDIRDLKLTKVQGKNGRQQYVLLKEDSMAMEEKFIRVLRDGFVSMDHAENILVIKTLSGMAMAVAAAIDSMHWNEVVGCIAGDDTLMCAIRSLPETISVMEKVNRIMK